MNQNSLNFRNNSLNLIRLLAALQVFYIHAVNHLELSSPNIINKILSLFMGVPIFFFLSGFLIWRSIDNSRNIKQYFFKRILRLYPELWCGVAVSLISIFVLYNQVQIKDIVLFAFTQSTFMQFWTPDSLRGFGCGTPNGSLWTIGVTVQFYIVAWFLKKLINKFHSLKLWIVLMVGFVLIGSLSPYLQSLLPEIIYKLYNQTFLIYFWMFLTGAFISEYFEQIVPFLKRFWWVFGILFYVTLLIDVDIIAASYPLFRSIFSCICCLGFAYAFPKLQIKHDLSYGIYIYHMIIINIVLHLGYRSDWWLLVLTLALTLLLAGVSYFTIGLFGKKKKKQADQLVEENL